MRPVSGKGPGYTAERKEEETSGIPEFSFYFCIFKIYGDERRKFDRKRRNKAAGQLH